MIDLTDLGWEVVEIVGGPSTHRGFLLSFTMLSAALACAAAWAIVTSSDPLNQPGWGLAAIAGSLAFGAGGVLVSVLHLKREPGERLLAAFCLLTNVTAVVIPGGWILLG